MTMSGATVWVSDTGPGLFERNMVAVLAEAPVLGTSRQKVAAHMTLTRAMLDDAAAMPSVLDLLRQRLADAQRLPWGWDSYRPNVTVLPRVGRAEAWLRSLPARFRSLRRTESEDYEW